MVTCSLVWNHFGRISCSPNLFLLLATPALLLTFSVVYSIGRSGTKISEIAFYLALAQIYAIFSIRISYLSVAAGYPLMDTTLNNLDAALGFRWLQWADFIKNYHLFVWIQQVAYDSFVWQPIFIVPVLAVWRPRWQNAEVMTAMLIAIMLTLFVATFVPAVGPADTLGLGPQPTANIIRILRATPGAQDLPYLGIVSFPSFHAAMAVLYVYAYHGLRWVFRVALAFNILMLISTSYIGDHYLIDIVAGLAVATFAIAVARYLVPVGTAGTPSGVAHKRSG